MHGRKYSANLCVYMSECVCVCWKKNLAKNSSTCPKIRISLQQGRNNGGDKTILLWLEHFVGLQLYLFPQETLSLKKKREEITAR